MKQGVKWACVGALAMALLAGCSRSADNKPKLLLWVPPLYPVVAASQRLEGMVRVQYDVGSDGQIHNARILQSTPANVYDDYVLQALKHWLYERDKPVNGVVKTIVFKLENPGGLQK